MSAGTIALVVAAAKNGVIGREGRLPWHIPSELKRFKALTWGKPIIMGRKTWESLPRRPLPGRRNIVLTRQAGFAAEGAISVHSVDEALAAAGDADEIAVIGGGEIYAMFMPRAARIYLTEVDMVAEGDTKFPPLDMSLWRETEKENHPATEDGAPAYMLRILDRVS
jgi:dihydrofolate reductase